MGIVRLRAVGCKVAHNLKSQDVLVGEGAYEGLFAVLDCGTEVGCDGFIFEGEMPPQPDPVETSAE